MEHSGLLVQSVKIGLRPLVSTSTGERVGINVSLHSPLFYPTSPPPAKDLLFLGQQLGRVPSAPHPQPIGASSSAPHPRPRVLGSWSSAHPP